MAIGQTAKKSINRSLFSYARAGVVILSWGYIIDSVGHYFLSSDGPQSHCIDSKKATPTRPKVPSGFE
ncbi:hypothetical protein PROFUN_05606 [Planoprotostelium fungivorum]|uniref:Uncharacterized protein n=1 Tax=Planoprotostelium fungivorum TaxID=1890364 RepID=A0A2P6N070_9EUKA|nr:hypothetical protein PROFUN_05606 [Planoprotostelium fungivorum]